MWRRAEAPSRVGATLPPPWSRREALSSLLGVGIVAGVVPGPGLAAAAHAGAAVARQPSFRPLPLATPYAASLLEYDSDGARVKALVAVPALPRPGLGFPMLVACHGFHPDPPRYGISASGENARPGDYYRSVPQWYADAGYLVVMPDYRGHNDSEGHADPGDPASTLGYAADVLALLDVLHAVPQGDARRVFLWGHSLGAEVVLRVLAAPAPTGVRSIPRVLGASLWSVAGQPPPIERLEVPVLLQHATGDRVAPSALADELATRLTALGRLQGIARLPGEAHFFEGAQAAAAVRRDLGFFGERLSMEASTREAST